MSQVTIESSFNTRNIWYFRCLESFVRQLIHVKMAGNVLMLTRMVLSVNAPVCFPVTFVR